MSQEVKLKALNMSFPTCIILITTLQTLKQKTPFRQPFSSEKENPRQWTCGEGEPAPHKCGLSAEGMCVISLQFFFSTTCATAYFSICVCWYFVELQVHNFNQHHIKEQGKAFMVFFSPVLKYPQIYNVVTYLIDISPYLWLGHINI